MQTSTFQYCSWNTL